MKRFSLLLCLLLTATACATAPESPANMAAPAPAAVPEPMPQADNEDQDGHGFKNPEHYAKSWNDPGRDEWQKPEEIVASLGLVPGQTVVDLGAGTGYLLPHLSQAVGPTGKVIALDVEEGMIEYLRNQQKLQGWSNVEITTATADDPGLAPESVDAVVTLNAWHHIQGRELYSAKLKNAIKPGGLVEVVDFIKEPSEGWGPPMEMRLDQQQVTKELEAGGFVAETVQETLPRHYIVRGRRP